MTGCDTTGKFSGKGKITCWNTLKADKPSAIISSCQLGETNDLSQQTFDVLMSLCAGYTVKNH